MNYKIALKKLKQIANPFEHIFLSNQESIVEKDIDDAIHVKKIFPENNLSEKESIVRAIAYEVLNKENKEKITLDFSQLNNENNWIVSSGVVELAAAIYNKEEEVIAQVIGEEKVIKSFLGKLIPLENSILPSEENVMMEKEDLFDWSIDIEILNESWNNEDFVFAKIQYLASEKMNTLKDFIAPALWKNKDFLLKCIEANIAILNILPYDVLLGENMWDIMLNEDKSSNIFKYIWDSDLKDIVKNKNYFENLNKNLQSGSIYITKEHIEEHILKNIPFIEKAIKNKRVDFLNYIDDNIKSNSQIIDALFLIKTEKNNSNEYNNFQSGLKLKNYLPKDFFDNVKNTLKIIECTGEDKFTLKNDKTLYQNWIDKKEDVLYFIENLDNKNRDFIIHIYEFLSKEMKKEKDVILAMMHKNSNIYHYINIIFQNDPKFIDLFIVGNKELSSAEDKIKKIIFEIKDEDKIKTIIKNNPNLLTEKGCPKIWRNNIELISLNRDYLRNNIERFPKTVIEKLFIENIELGQLIIQESSSYFHNHLPAKIQEIPEIALEFLKKREKREIDHIPEKLWLNKDFCIKAFNISPLTLKKIPFHFLKEKTMVLNIANNLDKGLIRFAELEYAPKEIKMFFEAFDIKLGEYHQFMTDYFFKEKMKKELNETVIKKVSKNKI